ncbi:MAG: hypothetical protein RBR40_11270 [Tenuifilaceae bacterium]|nr:hypothetical protein [Tenuifilaceae bacterium]
MHEATIIKRFRALSIHDDFILGARGYHIYKYCFQDRRLKKLYKVDDYTYGFLAKFPLVKRFFRAEITRLYHLANGADLLIAKKGIFKREKESKIFKKCFNITKGSRPLNICITPENKIYFGEYFSNAEQNEVHIYKSDDFGTSWDIVYTFPKGSINHIHGIFHDPYTNFIWVVTGDRRDEIIIGYTDNEFKTFKKIFSGGQKFRTCNLAFFEQHIIYATDSQYIKNKIKKIDRATLQIEDLCEINGSCIYAGQVGDFVYLSSTIEPSKINTEKYSNLYISKNKGKDWHKIAQYKKDSWNASVFQFGSIQFPEYIVSEITDSFVFSGRALKKVGGHTVIMRNE